MPYESYRGVSNHRPLTTNEKGAIIAGLTLIAPHAVLAAGRGWKTLGLIRKGITGVVIPSFLGPGLIGPIVPDLDFLGPGGGGPGHSLTSTTPSSLEATGASLAQRGKSGGPASSSKRRSRPRRKCKPGYRWNGYRCVRKD